MWAGIAAAVVLAIVAAGLFWTRGRDSAEAKAFCWGLIPARSLEALFPEGAFEEPRDEPLAYPRVIDERCRAFRKGSRLEWFEYKLTDAYDGVMVDNLSQVGGEYLMSPLGSGLVGAASDLGGWVEVPPCRPGDAPRFFAMYARRLDAEVWSRPDANRVAAKPGNRPAITALLIGTANAIRRQAHCGGDPLAMPELHSEAPPTPFDPRTLCGIPVAASGLPADPKWIQKWSGPDPVRENCYVATGPTDYRHVLELDVDRGPMADLVAPYARWGADGQVVSLGQGAGYTEVCTSGRVVYRLDTGLGFVGDPVRLLSALVAANAARDGCPSPQTPSPPS
ncbi:hypothetical protein GCM10023205_71380 [Yinghuangia aomiensis]|uniref:DUF1254 domain-containing protein n=2 Tax=Yinghuangia aomiensis TaxID=676205 RepID=A0ABP9I7M3_9ACTN